MHFRPPAIIYLIRVKGMCENIYKIFITIFELQKFTLWIISKLQIYVKRLYIVSIGYENIKISNDINDT